MLCEVEFIKKTFLLCLATHPVVRYGPLGASCFRAVCPSVHVCIHVLAGAFFDWLAIDFCSLICIPDD